MNEAMVALLGQSQLWLSQCFVILLRVGGVMALMPAFGEQMLPARVRLGLAIAFTLLTRAALDGDHVAALGTQPLSPWHLAEAAIGVLIGIMLRLFVLALQTAGAMIPQSISLSQLFGGTEGEPQPAVGTLLLLGGLTLALQLGLPVKMAQLLIASYDALPPGRMPSGGLVRAWGLSGLEQSFSLGFSVAMPFVLVGLLYNLALGAINRAMPQLMVSYIGAPAITFGGLALLAIAVPAGLHVWHDAFDHFLRDPFEIRP